MREIKFKFWLGHTKKMTYAHHLSEVHSIIPSFTPDIICLQYTGFVDKNGFEIYEGDILSLWYSRDTTGKDIIKFNQVVEFEFEFKGKSVFSGWNIPFLESAEIIGNKYETPHLLT